MNFEPSAIEGTGIGIRHCHYQTVLQTRPSVPWFEALSDNYLYDKAELAHLMAIREHYPVALHGVGLSLGSVDPIDKDYCQRLKNLAKTVGASSVSDHLSWVSAKQHRFHDLLPLPFTQDAIDHVVSRIQYVQDILGQPLLIENPSRYFDYKASTLDEWTFLNTIAEKSGCFILLDINNIYVTAYNHGFSAQTYLHQIKPAYVKQFHLAGFSNEVSYLFDTHGAPIDTAVWQLYQEAVKHFGYLPTLIERDDQIPAFDVLFAEAQYADTLAKQVVNAHELA